MDAPDATVIGELCVLARDVGVVQHDAARDALASNGGLGCRADVGSATLAIDEQAGCRFGFHHGKRRDAHRGVLRVGRAVALDVGDRDLCRCGVDLGDHGDVLPGHLGHRGDDGVGLDVDDLGEGICQRERLRH